MENCNNCNEKKIFELAEIERLRNEKIIHNQIQVDSRTLEKAFLEKLEFIRNSSLENLMVLDPYEFEKLVGKLYLKKGYRVEQTPKSNDKGKDLILTQKGQKYLVECKRYNSSNLVGRPELQKFFAAITEDCVELGYFVTTSDFTSTSYSYVKDIGGKIRLINGFELVNMIKSTFPNEGEDENFVLTCRECGENVHFKFPFDSVIICSNSHKVTTNEKSIKFRLLKEQPIIAPNCPKCKLIMVRRSSKLYNKLFWGCKNYPDCYGRLPYEF